MPDPRPPMGAPDPRPPMAGPPIREGSPVPEGVAPVVHSPRRGPRDHDTWDRGTRDRDTADYGPRDHDTDQEPGTDGPLLSRRVPQAHLAPELRRNGQASAPQRPGGPVPDAAEARAALSRYQASRQAAKAMVDDGDVEPGRPAGGGWP